MFNTVKDKLNEEVPATGGILFIVTSIFLAVALMWGVTLAKETTSSSVARSVSQTISLECLASCYINNVPTSSWNSNHVFSKISKNGQNINPLEQFNNAMHSYNLMRASDSCKEVRMKYNKGATNKDTTFTLQFGSYKVMGNWVSQSTIQPDAVKSVIEEK